MGFVPLSPTGAEPLFEVFSQRYESGSILLTTNLPFDEWTEVFGPERLTGALLDRLTHQVHILEMNGESYRLKHSRENAMGAVGRIDGSFWQLAKRLDVRPRILYGHLRWTVSEDISAQRQQPNVSDLFAFVVHFNSADYRTHRRMNNYKVVGLFRRGLNTDVHAFVNCLKAQAAMNKNILDGGGYRRFGIRY